MACTAAPSTFRLADWVCLIAMSALAGAANKSKKGMKRFMVSQAANTKFR